MKQVPLYFPPINKLGNNAFRKLLLQYRADYVFTEMIRCEKLLEEDIGQLRKLQINKKDIDKTFIQIIAEDMNNISKTIEKILKIHPNIKEINYNMGCPQSSLVKCELGGGIVGNLKKVKQTAQILAKECNRHNIIPSIKIRLGLTRDKITIYDNVKNIVGVGIKKIYIHGRTLSDTYNKPATYKEIKQVKQMFPDLEIIANGDVVDTKSYLEILKTNCDGILIGRAAMQNPTIFKELKNNPNYKQKDSGIELNKKKQILLDFINIAKKCEISISHIKTNINYMTKNTVKSSKFRNDLNNTKNLVEIEKIISVLHKVNK